MADHEPENNENSSRDEFNTRSGYYVYGIVSGATFSLCFSIFSFAMYMNGDGNGLWLAATIAGLAGTAGGIFETYRYVKEETDRYRNRDRRNHSHDHPDHPPRPPEL